MAGSIEFFPKQFVGAAYTQTIDEAVDTGGANFAIIQFWFDPPLTASNTVTVKVQHANVNDEASYVDAFTVAGGTTPWSTQFATGAAPSATRLVAGSGYGRFLRLVVTPSATTVTGNLRAVLVLRDTP